MEILNIIVCITCVLIGITMLTCSFVGMSTLKSESKSRIKTIISILYCLYLGVSFIAFGYIIV